MEKPPISLYWVSASNRKRGRLVFATTEQSALDCYGPEVSDDDGVPVRCRLIETDVRLLRVRWSGFLPRPADVIDLRGLGFEVTESGAGERISRRGDEVYIDPPSLNDVISAEHAREWADARGRTK